MSHTMKICEKEVEARLREEVMIWFHGKKDHYRCHVCFENTNEDIELESQECLCGSREMTWSYELVPREELL